MTGSVVSLLYHDIGPAQVGGHRSLSVDVRTFELQMRYLADGGWTALSMNDCLEIVTQNRTPKARSILITFDDGYPGVIDHALPVLERYGLKACVYVVAGRMGGIADWTFEDPTVRRPVFDRRHLDVWLKSGFDVGAHSMTHANLTELTADRVSDEIESSVGFLAAASGAPVLSIAYPYGYHNAAVRNIAARFAPLGFTTRPGKFSGADDPLSLPRCMVQPLNPHWDFRMMLRLGTSPLEYLRNLQRAGR